MGCILQSSTPLVNDRLLALTSNHSQQVLAAFLSRETTLVNKETAKGKVKVYQVAMAIPR